LIGKNKNNMKEVIRIGEVVQESVKPVEFTHYQNTTNGWITAGTDPNDLNKIVFLGKCHCDGDMFAGYWSNGVIVIYKGHLNSGKY
jgi:hypothetical protein